jgi:hypothetical protein
LYSLRSAVAPSGTGVKRRSPAEPSGAGGEVAFDEGGSLPLLCDVSRDRHSERGG